MTQIRRDNDADSGSDQKSRSGPRRTSIQPSSSSYSGNDDNVDTNSDGYNPLTYIPTDQSTYGDSDHDFEED